MWRVAILGHSYIRDLYELGDTRMKFKDGIDCKIHYYFKPGSTFAKWNNYFEILDKIVELNPNIILVYLGGNSITEDISDRTLRDQAKQFYNLLRSLLPEAIVIASQIELRFVEEGNRHKTPTLQQFKIRRNTFNQFLRKFKNAKGIDYIARISGGNRLDKVELYLTAST